MRRVRRTVVEGEDEIMKALNETAGGPEEEEEE